MATTKKEANEEVQKSGVVFGFAITALVFLCIGTFGTFIAGCFDFPVFVVFLFQLAGLITYSIFISQYKKNGHDLKITAYGVVFIVFAFFTWGVFSLVTGILALCLKKPENK